MTLQFIDTLPEQYKDHLRKEMKGETKLSPLAKSKKKISVVKPWLKKKDKSKNLPPKPWLMGKREKKIVVTTTDQTPETIGENVHESPRKKRRIESVQKKDDQNCEKRNPESSMDVDTTQKTENENTAADLISDNSSTLWENSELTQLNNCIDYLEKCIMNNDINYGCLDYSVKKVEIVLKAYREKFRGDSEEDKRYLVLYLKYLQFEKLQTIYSDTERIKILKLVFPIFSKMDNPYFMCKKVGKWLGKYMSLLDDMFTLLQETFEHEKVLVCFMIILTNCFTYHNLAKNYDALTNMISLISTYPQSQIADGLQQKNSELNKIQVHPIRKVFTLFLQHVIRLVPPKTLHKIIQPYACKLLCLIDANNMCVHNLIITCCKDVIMKHRTSENKSDVICESYVESPAPLTDLDVNIDCKDFTALLEVFEEEKRYQR
eukprot:UN01781